MLKNALWGALGLAIPLLTLSAARHLGWSPPTLPFGPAAVWIGGFILMLVLIRAMDAVFKGLFARRPWTERFATGLLIGCWIFAGIFDHN